MEDSNKEYIEWLTEASNTMPRKDLVNEITWLVNSTPEEISRQISTMFSDRVI